MKYLEKKYYYYFSRYIKEVLLPQEVLYPKSWILVDPNLS